MKNPEVATVSLIAVIMMIALYYNLNYRRQKSRLIINVIGLLIIVAVYHFEKSIIDPKTVIFGRFEPL